MGKILRAVGILGIALADPLAFAQTRLQTPVIIQRKSTSPVAAGQIVFPNSANIDCVAANYATCVPAILQNNDATGDLTLLNPVNTTTRLFLGTSGSVAGSDQFSLWRAGQPGPRAQLLPGGALGSGRVLLGNTAGTFYTGFIADPAMTVSSIYEMPATDGAAGECISTNGALKLSWTACSGGGGVTLPVVDTTFISKGSVDATKRLRFEVDGLATATDRVWTAQDADITVAGINIAQTWTATQTMRDVLPSVTDAYKLGDTNRWYQVAANRIEGICTTAFTCTSTNNYISSRKLNLWDSGGSVGGGFWDLFTVAASPATSYLTIRDQAGANFLTLTRQSFSVTTNTATLDGHLLPSTSATYDLGNSSSKWRNLALSALAGSGTRCVEADNDGILGIASGACSTPPFTDSTNIIKGSGDATKLFRFEVDGFTTGTIRTGTVPNADLTFAGINLAQTWTATQTMRDINPSVTNTYKLGDDSLTLKWYSVAANRWDGLCSFCSSSTNYMTTRKLELHDNSGLGSGAWDFMTTVSPATSSYLQIRDNSGTEFVTFYKQLFGSTVTNAVLNAHLRPYATATYDLGSASSKWQNAYANNFIGSSFQNTALSGFGTNCAIIDNSGFVSIPSAWGTCVTASRTISTSGPLGGGGALSSNLTLTCSTCVTTAGGQSIAGTTTLSTASISSAISGTFALSGNMTVTGNLYVRTFSGGDINCSSPSTVAAGWIGFRTDTNEIQMCTTGGVMKKIGLI